MQLLVKTLKGEKFQIDVEESQTFAQVKAVIESTKSELPAASLKLIHSGKVLKDDATVASAGMKEKDFLVVMVAKAKKPKEEKPKAETPAAPPAEAAAADATQSDAAPTPATPAAATTSATTPAAPSAPSISQEAVANLVAMGFPEAEVQHCLRAAHGNPDVAVEFLTNGIPDGVAEAAALMGASTPATASTPAASSSSGAPLQALRNHPQFNDLRRLVQSNPQMLQQVLTQIGQQQPDLLAEINANQALFLEIMNEPVTESSSAAPSGSSSPPEAAAAGMGAMMDGAGSPIQMAQMIQSMSPEELNEMAAMMGLSPDQLRQTAQMIGQLPPEQLQQFMQQAMGSGAGGMEGGPGGPQVLRLSPEEMEAVDRLAAMGFDRSEAAQAFLACDKNEQLAANLLMDSMGSGGGAFFDDTTGGGSGGGGDNNNDEDMYD